MSKLTKQYLNSMIQEAFKIADEKGWHEQFVIPVVDPKVLGAQVALIHSEVSEIWQAVCVCCSDPEFDRSNVAEEAADVCIRCFDMLGCIQHEASEDKSLRMSVCTNTTYHMTKWLMGLHYDVSIVLERIRDPELHSTIGTALEFVIMSAFAGGSDIVGSQEEFIKVIDKKMEKNRHRTRRHGGKVL
jgi:hypothetical protein